MTKELTILEFFERIGKNRPQDLPNFKRVIDIVLPALAARQGLPFDPDNHEDREAVMAIAPAHWLLECLTQVGGAYEAWLTDAVPDLLLVKAYNREYRGAFNRCLEHGVMAHVLSTAVKGVGPEWLADRQRLAESLPINDEQRLALIAKGKTEYYGKNLETEARLAKLWARKHLDCFNVFARFMTARCILGRTDVTQDLIHGAKDSFYNCLADKNASARYYNAKAAWIYLADLLPDVPVVAWPEPGKDREYGLKPDERSPIFSLMLVKMRKAIEDAYEKSTADLCEKAMTLYAGFLKREQGIDEALISQDLGGPQDLALFFLGPFPTPADGRVPDSEVELAMLLDDPGYRRRIVDWGARNIRHSWSQEAPRANPMLREFLDWHLDRGTGPSAKVYVNPFITICQTYLEAAEIQTQWLAKQRGRVRRKQRDAPPSARKRNKNLVCQAEDLWLKLVEARGRLDKITDKLRAKMEARPGHGPTARAWATAQRDKVAFKMILAYPMRATTFHLMIKGTHILLDTWQIHVRPDQTKGHSEVLRTIPDSGVFGELRQDIQEYLDLAVPILLNGRPETPYFLITNFRGPQILDEEGNLMADDQAFARIIRKLTRTVFKDLLPEGVRELTPHSFRDLFSDFVVEGGGTLDMIAKALANSPAVAAEHYASRVHKNDKDIHDFVDARVDARKADQTLCKLVSAIIRTPVSPEQVKKLRKLFARHR